jgi:hypothetical protein
MLILRRFVVIGSGIQLILEINNITLEHPDTLSVPIWRIFLLLSVSVQLCRKIRIHQILLYCCSLTSSSFTRDDSLLARNIWHNKTKRKNYIKIYRILIRRQTCTETNNYDILELGYLHPVACTRSGSGLPSNATLFWIFYSITATYFGRMTIFRWKYFRLKMVIRPKHVAVIK